MAVSRFPDRKSWEPVEFQIPSGPNAQRYAGQILREVCRKLDVKAGGVQIIYSGETLVEKNKKSQKIYILHVLLYAKKFSCADVEKWASETIRRLV